MWREKPIPILKSEKNPQSERRAVKRVHTAIPLTINLVGEVGAPPPPPITVQTTDISPQGVSTVINIRILKVEDGRVSIQEEIKNSAKIVKHLLVKDTVLGLGIHILPQGKSVSAMGTVRWHARSLNEGLYAVRVGILLDEIDRADKKEWFDFLRAIYDFLACFYREGGNARGSTTTLYPD